MKLKNTLLAFPFQFPLLYVLTFGVKNLADLNIWWCVLIAFGINVLYDVGENEKFCVECPGENWVRGRIKKKTKS